MQNKKWARLLAYVTGLVNQQLLRQNEYLAAENRILRSHLPARLRLSDPKRSTLAEIGKRLGRGGLEGVAGVGKPDTILAWYRRPTAHRWQNRGPDRTDGHRELRLGIRSDRGNSGQPRPPGVGSDGGECAQTVWHRTGTKAVPDDHLEGIHFRPPGHAGALSPGAAVTRGSRQRLADQRRVIPRPGPRCTCRPPAKSQPWRTSPRSAVRGPRYRAPRIPSLRTGQTRSPPDAGPQGEGFQRVPASRGAGQRSVRKTGKPDRAGSPSTEEPVAQCPAGGAGDHFPRGARRDFGRTGPASSGTFEAGSPERRAGGGPRVAPRDQPARLGSDRDPPASIRDPQAGTPRRSFGCCVTGAGTAGTGGHSAPSGPRTAGDHAPPGAGGRAANALWLRSGKGDDQSRPFSHGSSLGTGAGSGAPSRTRRKPGESAGRSGIAHERASARRGCAGCAVRRRRSTHGRPVCPAWAAGSDGRSGRPSVGTFLARGARRHAPNFGRSASH